MLPSDVPVANYWIAAARSGRLGPVDWKNWADSKISESDVPENWLIDMSLANSLDDLRRALQPKLETESISDESVDDAVLGHIWHRYESGDISLSECLKRAAEDSDSSSASIECEELYALLNDLESLADENRVRSDASRLFSHVHQVSAEQWHALFSN